MVQRQLPDEEEKSGLAEQNPSLSLKTALKQFVNGPTLMKLGKGINRKGN